MNRKKLLTVCLIVLLLFAVGQILDRNTASTPAQEHLPTTGPADPAPVEPTAIPDTPAQQPGLPETPTEPEAPEAPDPDRLPVYGESYYDVTNVVLYLELYGELPPNYITKKEAQNLGWTGGSVEDWLEGAAIGGDSFGNREGLLPTAKGRRYTECDIDTDGYSSRGSRRLVFSNDGLYFYTSDHYEHFSEVTVTAEYEVIW